MDEIERCARAMGMKPHREVLEVVPVDGGYAVRTHDEQWTLVRDDGTVQPTKAPELVVERDHGTAELASGGIVTGPAAKVIDDGCIVPPAAKPETKRRARS